MEEIENRKREKLVSEIKQSCKRYVIGALYGDMKELLYSFSKKEQWIKLNPQMEIFVLAHKDVIESLNYHKWASFYEKVNTDETQNRIRLLMGNFEKRKNESIYRGFLRMNLKERRLHQKKT